MTLRVRKKNPPSTLARIGSYRVVWEIDIDATSHVEAARKALDIQRDQDSLATVFIIHDENKISMTIDLQPVGHPEDD